MARYANCKTGVHRYAPAAEVGGGIARRICSECGLVQIDVTNDEHLSDTELFTEPKLATMFQVEALLAQVTTETSERSFGEAPLQRRRPIRAFG